MLEVDLIILGKVKSQPSSAYELQKDMDRRNLSDWVNISTTSVYKAVLRLENNGYLKGHTIREGKMPEKTIYEITPEGEVHLKRSIRKLAKDSIRILFPFNAAVVNMGCIEPEEALEMIRDLRTGIEKTRQYMTDAFLFFEELPLEERTIIRQQTMVADVLAEWAEDFERRFRADKHLESAQRNEE